MTPNALTNHLNEVVNPTWNYADRHDTHQDQVMNAVLGLGGETGEVLDVIKKASFHSQSAAQGQMDKLVYEMGDVIYYWLKLADLFNLDIEHILAMNRMKLESRHPELGKVTERFGAGAIKG